MRCKRCKKEWEQLYLFATLYVLAENEQNEKKKQYKLKTTLTFSFDEFGRFLDAGHSDRGRAEH